MECGSTMGITSRLKDLLKENIDRSSAYIHHKSFSLEDGVEFLQRKIDYSLIEFDTKDDILLQLTKMSLFEEASENSPGCKWLLEYN